MSLSFDNAVVNATMLVRMSAFWQKIFLTVGVAIAVFGMRLVFPLLIVGITAKLSPVEAVRLALEKGDPDTKGTYGYLLHEAHPAIAAFGGVFLLMIFLDFVFEEREITWLTLVEKAAAPSASSTSSPSCSPWSHWWSAPTRSRRTTRCRPSWRPAASAWRPTCSSTASASSSTWTRRAREGAEADAGARSSGPTVVKVVGKAAFFLFLYLEVLDASFSFDGVVGAFAITSDPIIIAIGLGIGAMFIRSLTVFLVRKGTLTEYVYLEHGALWAIGALAVLLLFTIKYDVPEVVTGLIGVGFIGAAFASSVVRNRRAAVEDDHTELRDGGPLMPIDYTKRPQQPAATPPPAASGPVVLTKAAPAVSLQKSGGGLLRVNLNWNARPTEPRGFFQKAEPSLDLDLGCLYEFTDGTKGVVQALGNAFTAGDRTVRTPIIRLDGDDRSGAVAGGREPVDRPRARRAHPPHPGLRADLRGRGQLGRGRRGRHAVPGERAAGDDPPRRPARRRSHLRDRHARDQRRRTARPPRGQLHQRRTARARRGLRLGHALDAPDGSRGAVPWVSA